MTTDTPSARLLTLLRGPAALIRRAALAELPPAEGLIWLGGPHDNAPHVNRILGGELKAAVVDAASALDANRLGAIIGAIRGGGELVWLDAHDVDVTSRMTRRCLRLIAEDPDARVLGAADFPHRSGRGGGVPTTVAADEVVALNADQLRIADAVVGVLTRDAPPVVVIADRGRGKSTALGVAAARALGALPQEERIIVTSAHRQGALQLLAQGRALCRLRGQDPDRLHYAPVDAVLADEGASSALLVDEAASLPVATLAALVQQFPRIAMATTARGYEGTGQGFTINFAPRLDRAHPDWRLLTLTHALRHRSQDAVERTGMRFMGFALPASASASASAPDAEVDAGSSVSAAGVPRTSAAAADGAAAADAADAPMLIPPEALLADEAALLGIFELLRTAHYRTRPGDLARMLDDPRVRVWCQGGAHAPIGCAITIDEGELDAALAQAMVRGERRPRGHLGAGVLAERLGIAAGARVLSTRINRIAVHADHRRRGTGQRLVATMAADARERGAALLTSSFGAAPWLLDFWHRCDLETLRLGERRERSTGLRAAFVACALNPQGEAILHTARQR